MTDTQRGVMNLNQFLAHAKYGTNVTIFRTDHNSNVSVIQGNVSGWDINTEPVEIGGGTYHQLAPGRTTATVTLSPWNVRIDINPSDTFQVNR